MKRSEALLFGAAVAAHPLAARAQRAPAVRVAGGPDENYAEPFYAEQIGAFKRARLDAEVKMLTNGGVIVTALAAGAVDLGIANLATLASAYARGLPVMLLAPGSLYSSAEPSTALLVAKSSTIRTAKELAGKKIAVISLNSILHIAVKNWIDKNGGESGASQYIEMPVSDMTPALLAGRVDAAAEGEPWISRAKEQTRVVGYPFDSVASRFLITAWGVNKNWLDKNPAAARSAAAAVRDTAQWANGHPKESADILSSVLKIPLAAIAAVPRVSHATTLDPRLIQPVIDVAAKYKVLPRAFPAASFIASQAGS